MQRGMLGPHLTRPQPLGPFHPAHLIPATLLYVHANRGLTLAGGAPIPARDVCVCFADHAQRGQ